MRPDDVSTRQELWKVLRARIHKSFVRAKICLQCARGRVDRREFKRWMKAAGDPRSAAARWRSLARSIAPALVWCITIGFAKAPLPQRELSADFEVQPAPDGSSIVWSLQFKTRQQYHLFLDTTAGGADCAKIRETIAPRLKLHHLAGCSAQERAVTKFGDDGIPFVGACAVAAHAVPVGGI